jgi:hypothetical protein
VQASLALIQLWNFVTQDLNLLFSTIFQIRAEVRLCPRGLISNAFSTEVVRRIEEIVGQSIDLVEGDLLDKAALEALFKKVCCFSPASYFF